MKLRYAISCSACLLSLSACGADKPSRAGPRGADGLPIAGTSTHGVIDAGTPASLADASVGAEGGLIGIGNSTNDGGVLRCVDKAPPNSFEPDLQWKWDGYAGQNNCLTLPLVANLTDDNADGKVDLNDIPDIVVVVFSTGTVGTMVVLDGATGSQHYVMQQTVRYDATPALGDIDGDGLIDIVTLANGDDWKTARLIAFNHDGSLKWSGDLVTAPTLDMHIDVTSVALADMTGDGSVEILAGNSLYDAAGHLIWTADAPPPWWAATAAVDLDGDGELEMVLGTAAYHADGTEYFRHDEIESGFPQIADMNGDGQPEILITSLDGLSMLAHDGTPIFVQKTPAILGSTDPTYWLRPAAIHDFNGDGKPDFASATPLAYSVFHADASVLWSATVSDVSGIASGTAFDFLGDGTAEALYGDEHNLFIFGGDGKPVYTQPRSSNTGVEYPVVADVDNDGSAEIVVVSDIGTGSDTQRSPAVQVFRDKQERWIQARRIWNEHTYHVTNINEDGSIPRHEAPHWKALNTFRTNAQIEGGAVCAPKGPD